MANSKLYVEFERVRWKNGKGLLHRDDGPAIVYSNGSKGWLKNGNLHREDGPACEHSDGTKYWYLNGNKYTEKEYNAKIKTLR